MADTGSTFNFQKITEEIKNAFSTLAESMNALYKGLDVQASSIVGAMGQSRQYAAGIQQSLSLAVPELQAISTGSIDFADALAKAKKAQDEILDGLQVNLLLTSQQMVAIAEVTQAYSLQAGTVGTMAENFITVGKSINDFPEALNAAANNARAVGVNVDAVMKNISIGLDDMNKFGFEDGVEGLGRMAAQAAALRINMKGIFDFAEKVFDPEGAIKMVAAFQRMGVAAGDLADPFRLMYLASEDTEELTKQISKVTEGFTFFNEKTKSFELYPNAKRDLRVLQVETGIAYDDLVKMSQATERLKIVGRDLKLGGDIPEETKQFIANVAQYDKTKGGFVVKLNTQGDTKLVSQINSADIKAIQDANAELSPKEIARAALDTEKIIQADVAAIRATIAGPLAGTRIVSSSQEILRGATGTAREGFTNLVRPREFQSNVDQAISSSIGTLNDVISGKQGLGDVLGKFAKFGDNFVTGLETLSNRVMSFDYSTQFKKDIMPDNVFAGLGNTITDVVSKGFVELSKSFGVDVKSQTLTQNVNQNTNVKVEDIKIDVSGSVSVNGKNNEQVTISPELKSYIEGIIRSEIEKNNNIGKAMPLKPNTTTQ